jgi:23S rRNA pseudouridine2605 synthase
LEKEYLAEVRGTPSRAALRRLREGIELDDGVTAPASASLVDGPLVKLAIHEGRNRQVRRMLEAVGHPVIRLIRVRIGPITDRRLAPGSWRTLTSAELRSLEAAVGTASRTQAGPPDPDR